MKIYSLIIFVSIVSLYLPQCDADVYKFVDKNGVVYYTDEPKNPRYKLIIRTRKKKPSINVMSANRKKFAAYIKAAAEKHDLDPALIDAVIRVESAYNPHAVSKKGAIGLMQLMPATATRYGVKNPRNPQQNIDGGADYLSDLLRQFNSDLKLALAAYNAGEQAVIEHGNQIPPYRETQNYVARVIKFYRPNS